MDEILSNINAQFKSPHFEPDKLSLVDMDGFDELEKESAVKFFLGKNSVHILSHLRHGGAYYLEEWTVLNIAAIVHYASAYFSYLLETLDSKEPDEEYVYFLIGALYQIIYIHKGSPFNSTQTELIKYLVELSMESSKDHVRFEYFSKDIQDSSKEFFNELNKYRG